MQYSHYGGIVMVLSHSSTAPPPPPSQSLAMLCKDWYIEYHQALHDSSQTDRELAFLFP